MESKTKITGAGRRRKSNRHADYYHSHNRVGSSFGQPVHIGFYLNSMQDGSGSMDRNKIIELFNAESYG